MASARLVSDLLASDTKRHFSRTSEPDISGRQLSAARQSAHSRRRRDGERSLDVLDHDEETKRIVDRSGEAEALVKVRRVLILGVYHDGANADPLRGLQSLLECVPDHEPAEAASLEARIYAEPADQNHGNRTLSHAL